MYEAARLSMVETLRHERGQASGATGGPQFTAGGDIVFHSSVIATTLMTQNLQTIEGAETDPALKQTLEQLHRHVNTMLSEFDSDEQELVAEDLADISTEAVRARDKRNLPRLRRALNGLSDFALRASRAGAPVVALADDIKRLLGL